jgi:glycosyltransferase involved in cell wall biosynthesis
VTAPLFAGCTAFVLPSRHEPFGIVNLEAMAASKPVVATDVGGVAEFVEADVTGLLVPPDDAPALAAALVEVLARPALAHELGARGAKRSLEFDWSRIAGRYADVYDIALR